jgi:hypothetical protein
MTDMMNNIAQTTDLMKNVMQATQDYNTKVLEFASANGSATLAYLSKLAATRTPSELIELTTRHMREQTEVLTRQARELTGMTQKPFLSGSS